MGGTRSGVNSLSKEVLIQVASLITSKAAWYAIGSMFLSVSRSRINNIRTALANTYKENKKWSLILQE
jgi:hypothetical protein